MSGVKRYEHAGDYCGPRCGFEESADGDWVFASDYDALAQRCRELEGRADALSQELKAVLSDWNALVHAIQSPTHGGAVGHAAGVVRERDTLRADVEQLRATAPHLNAAEHLPPVDCPLLILLDGRLVRATRTGFVASRGAQLEYRLEPGGQLLHGRYCWTYP